jgi:3-ketosteroid 9alpha-monooxygenase subunit A
MVTNLQVRVPSKASFDVTNRVTSFQDRGFAFETFPIGWFQVGWSDEFPVGEAKALSYFGDQQVAFRGESGNMHVFDAFCPHLGGHLGHGGTVHEDSIVCPFHGWRFDSSGANVEIPYSKDCSRRSLTAWEVRENAGAVFVWYHPNKNPPSWELPDPVVKEWVDSSFHQPFPHSVQCREIFAPPQWVVENAIDVYHLQYVHRTPPPTGWAMREADADRPHYLAIDIDAVFDTPRGLTEIKGLNEVHGLGLVVNHLDGLLPTGQMQCVTPIDHTRSHIRFSIFVPRQPGDAREDAPSSVSKAVVDAEMYELYGPDRDFPIWENMRYRDRPSLTKEEAELYGGFRRWIRQFYIR